MEEERTARWIGNQVKGKGKQRNPQSINPFLLEKTCVSCSYLVIACKLIIDSLVLAGETGRKETTYHKTWLEISFLLFWIDSQVFFLRDPSSGYLSPRRARTDRKKRKRDTFMLAAED